MQAIVQNISHIAKDWKYC